MDPNSQEKNIVHTETIIKTSKDEIHPQRKVVIWQ